jgi:hypothetical protein
MYGVPDNLPLQRFVGKYLEAIQLGKFQIQFHFAEAGSISIQGKWELHDLSGALIDGSQDPSSREFYRVHMLLNETVTDQRIDPPDSFMLTFSSGHRLTVYDDTPGQYESFSISPDGIYI